MNTNKNTTQVFKLIYNEESQKNYRIRGSIKSYNDLLSAINERFEDLNGYSLEYKDSDKDLVRINCEEDFQILLEEFEGKNGLHWRLSCVIRAFTSQEDTLAAMIVVHDILEYAEGCLLG